MDDQESSRSLAELIEWAARVRDILRVAHGRDDAPILDIEWLQLRCNDTLLNASTPEDARDSAMQLLRDVEDFIAEFPGIIPENEARPAQTPKKG